MAKTTSANSLYDARRGSPALAIERVELSTQPTEPPRMNYFAIYWIESGEGTMASLITRGPAPLR